MPGIDPKLYDITHDQLIKERGDLNKFKIIKQFAFLLN